MGGLQLVAGTHCDGVIVADTWLHKNAKAVYNVLVQQCTAQQCTAQNPFYQFWPTGAPPLERK